MACSSTGALQSLPLLVFEHQPTRNESTTAIGVGGDDQEDIPEMLMFSVSEERTCTEPTPAMLSPQDNQICFATPQGWIFIIHGASPWETWLWHPITGETIPLTPIRDDHYVPTSCTCLLTHSSVAHPDCAVVLFDVDDPDMWFCRVNGGTNRAWGQHTYNIGEYTLPEPEDDGDGDGHSTSTPPTKRVIPTLVAAQGGKLHFIFSELNQYKMGVVHLDFGSAPAPTAELHTLEDVDAAITMPEGMCSGVSWLLDSLGELFRVCVCFREFNPDDIGAVLVFKMDFDHGRCWRRVH